MRLYLDASVIVPLFSVETGTAAIGALLAPGFEAPLVSAFTAGEVASAFARRVRMGELSDDDARSVLLEFDGWHQTGCQTPGFDSADIDLAALFVRRFELKLRLPDAIHAAACDRLGATLVTFDHRLATAATALGIDALVPA